MTVGTSIFLIVVGAILSYAITWELPAVDVAAVGVILMLAGLLGLVISVGWAFHPNRRATQQDRLGAQHGRDGRDSRDGRGGLRVATFGEPPPAPRWNSCVPPPTTYTVPFDGHLAAEPVPPTPVPPTDPYAPAPDLDLDSPVVAPWYSAEHEPYARGDFDAARADTDPDARTGPATWWPGPGT